MSKLQMVCKTCGSCDVRADAYAYWNVEDQAWELSTTFDKGAVCEVCEGECSIDEQPLDDWEAKQNETQVLENKEYHAEELEEGDFKAVISDEDVGVICTATTDQYGDPLRTRDEALDEARRRIMQEEFS